MKPSHAQHNATVFARNLAPIARSRDDFQFRNMMQQGSKAYAIALCEYQAKRSQGDDRKRFRAVANALRLA